MKGYYSNIFVSSNKKFHMRDVLSPRYGFQSDGFLYVFDEVCAGQVVIQDNIDH